MVARTIHLGWTSGANVAAQNYFGRTSFTSPYQTKYNTLFTALTGASPGDNIFNADGTSNYLDGLWIWKTENQTDANKSLIGVTNTYLDGVTSSTVVPSGGTPPTWTAAGGYVFAAANTNYLDANIVMSTTAAGNRRWEVGTGQTCTGAWHTAYSGTAHLVRAFNRYAWLCTDPGNNRYDGTSNVGDFAACDDMGAPPAQSAYAACERTDTTHMRFIYNGSQTGSIPVCPAEDALPWLNICFGGEPNSPAYSNCTLIAGFFGKRLGTALHSTLYTALNTFFSS